MRRMVQKCVFLLINFAVLASTTQINEERKDLVGVMNHVHRLKEYMYSNKYSKNSNNGLVSFVNSELLTGSSLNEIGARAERALLDLKAKKYDVSSTCLNHTEIFLEALVKRETWAERSMFPSDDIGIFRQWKLPNGHHRELIDAMGKPPSGLLDLNLNWLGSWDECRSVEATVNRSFVISHPYKGHYCRAMFPFNFPSGGQSSPFAGAPFITIGICFPDSCSTADTVGLTETLVSLLPINSTELPPPTLMCDATDNPYSSKAIAVLVVCSIFLAIVAMATTYDILIAYWLAEPSSVDNGMSTKEQYGSFNGYDNRNHASNGHVVDDRTPLLEDGQLSNGNAGRYEADQSAIESKKHVQNESTYKPGFLGKLLLAFSVYTNAPKILNTKQPAGTLTAINGVRFISMTWVILGHTYAFGLYTVSNAGVYVPEKEAQFSFQAISNATFAVDTFFVLSGLLVSFLSLKEMQKRGGVKNFKWGMYYFHRFWRLTPPYMLFLMTYVPLARYFADGPLYPSEVGFEKDECKDTWWANLLYINNLYKPEEMCMAWSWYLANDMQFFVISPLMLIPLYYSPLWGTISCLGLVLINFIVSGTISKHYSLGSNAILQQNFGASFDKLYIKPWCRVGPYAVGFFTGYILYKTNCKVKMPKIVNVIGWLVAATLAMLILYGLYSPDNEEFMSVDVSALYNATSRSVWGACIAWVVFSCAVGYGGPINKLLSWPGIIPLSRLTYCAYLVHPVIMYTYYFSHRNMIHWYDIEVAYSFLGHLCMSYAVAFVISLVYESPMMGLEKVIFGREKNS